MRPLLDNQGLYSSKIYLLVQHSHICVSMLKIVKNCRLLITKERLILNIMLYGYVFYTYKNNITQGRAILIFPR